MLTPMTPAPTTTVGRAVRSIRDPAAAVIAEDPPVRELLLETLPRFEVDGAYVAEFTHSIT